MPTATTDAPRAAAPAAETSVRRPLLWAVWVALLAVVAVGVVALGALPYRAWVDQRQQLRETEARLTAIQEQNDALEARIAALQTPAEVERLARERYGLARPGEQSFVILPQATTPLPPGWPYGLLAEILTARGTSSPPAAPVTEPPGTTAAEPTAAPAAGTG
jgi:cell division protein FtsB